MNIQEGLIEARRRLEGGWIRELWACDALGEAVSPGSSQAYAYCAEGAVFSIADLDVGTTLDLLEEALPTEWRKDIDNINEFNDYERTTKDDVLALYDRAIARANQLESRS